MVTIICKCKSLFSYMQKRNKIFVTYQILYDVLGKKSWSENYMDTIRIDCCLPGCDCVRQQKNSTRSYDVTFLKTWIFIITVAERLRSYLSKCVKCICNPIFVQKVKVCRKHTYKSLSSTEKERKKLSLSYGDIKQQAIFVTVFHSDRNIQRKFHISRSCIPIHLLQFKPTNAHNSIIFTIIIQKPLTPTCFGHHQGVQY
jgi:hypothetical protein